MKGSLSQVISKARFGDDPKLCTVTYRDGGRFLEATLEGFIDAKDADGEPVQIPIHGITEVKRAGEVVWRKKAV